MSSAETGVSVSAITSRKIGTIAGRSGSESSQEWSVASDGVGSVASRLGGLFSVVIVMALTGGMLLPFTTGALGALYGLRGSFLVVPAALMLQALLLVVVTRRFARLRTA